MSRKAPLTTELNSGTNTIRYALEHIGNQLLFDKPTCIVGMDTVIDINKCPHILIAGQTGSGKSSLLHSMLTSLLFTHGTNKLELCMIDTKQIELTQYDKICHMVTNTATSAPQAINLLEYVCGVMDKRYKTMRKKGTKDCQDPYMIIIIDEYADLTISQKAKTERLVQRIAQLGRAANIHLIIATQRINKTVINPIIRANLPCKIALQCANRIDSQIILDNDSAAKLEKFHGILQCQGMQKEIKIPWCNDSDVQYITKYWKR